jgi:hypothetical protein
MAGLVSITRGRDPEYYTQVSKGPEYYSAGAGIEGLEPAGTWTGRGCPDLGLQVGAEIDKGVFLKPFGDLTDPRDGSHLGRALPRYEGWRPIYEEYLAAEPEATAERRKELENQAKAAVPHAVRYFDATLSPSKDITLLHASFMAAKVRAAKEGQAGEAARYAGLADTVWAAVMEGNQAMLDHFQEHAGYTRSGSHARKVGGETTGLWEDAHAFIVASFRQHTPQRRPADARAQHHPQPGAPRARRNLPDAGQPGPVPAAGSRIGGRDTGYGERARPVPRGGVRGPQGWPRARDPWHRPRPGGRVLHPHPAGHRGQAA